MRKLQESELAAASELGVPSRQKGSVMRRLFPILLGGVLALSGVASATHNDNLNPKHDFAVGGGRHLAGGTGPEFVTQGFAAQSGPDGENPKGYVSANSPGVEGSKTQGHVVCLNVVGNEAFILWKQERRDSNVPEGTLILLHVVDNGPPVEGMPADMIRNSFSPFIIPPELGGGPCGTPTLPPVPLTEGNITVHDGSLLLPILP